MPKLKLEIDELAVESFPTERARSGAGGDGTVHAHNHTRGGHATCVFSCQGSCDCNLTEAFSCIEPCV